jgi:hypothetical protein
MKSVINLFLAVALPTALAFVPQQAHVTTTNYWGMTSMSRSDVRVFAEKEAGSALNIIIAGAPASGKGTQCEVIKEKFGIVHLSTGDMLRAAVAAKTEVGVKAKDFMDSGKLVPDEVIIGIVGGQKERFFFGDLLNNMYVLVNLMECFCRCIINLDQGSTCRKRLPNGRMVVGWVPAYRRTSQGSCCRRCLGRLFHFLGCS